jgi:hypothetical protein
MDQDLEHLRLLSIFHYVVGIMLALFSCFPIIHFGVGIALWTGMIPAEEDVPARAMGVLFTLVAGLFIIGGWFLAACMIQAGRYLSRQVNRTFCLVVAGIECIFTPFGTVLGVFTIIVISRDSVRELFERTGGHPPPEALE